MHSPQYDARSRRHFLRTAGAVGAALWFDAPLASAATQGRSPWARDNPVAQIRKAALTDPISVQPVRGNVSCIAGSGGNILLLDEPDGSILIDGGLAGARVAAAARGVTAAPIRYLINTHWHFDHTDGNPWLAAHGAEVVAHERTRWHLSRPTRVEDYDYTFEPIASEGVPATVFTDRHQVTVGRTTLELQHYAPAHTDSDIAVRIGHADVLHVGDTWWNGVYPFIDYSTGGSIDGLIAATESTLAATGAGTIIVPGHGPAGDRSRLRQYRDMLATARERIARLKRQGLSVSEVLRTRPMAAFDDSWGTALVNPDFFTRLVYKGV